MTVAAAAVIAPQISECSHIGSPSVAVTVRHTEWRELLSRFILLGISHSTCRPTTKFRRAPHGARLRRYKSPSPARIWRSRARSPLARVRDRSAERALMAEQLSEESRQIEAARQRLATGILSAYRS